MTDTTFSRRLYQLIKQVKNHPNRDEIIKLAKEQLIDEAEFTIIRN
jgi:hypothetical protein